jgi:hypothetical protein
MRRRLCIAGVATALAATGAMAPVAEASPYLGGGEARQALGRALHRDSTYGAVTGSLRAQCYRVQRNFVRCYIAFQDLDGDYWCGPASVRETRTSYRYGWNLELC